MNTIKKINDILAWNPKTEVLVDSNGITDVKSVRRSDNGKLLGVVGKERFIASNEAIVSPVVAMANALNIPIDNCKAYEVHNGASFRFRLPIEPLSIGEDNKCYINFSASHDSTVKHSFNLFVERLICANGMTAFVRKLGNFAKFAKNYEVNFGARFEGFEESLKEQREEIEATYKSLRSKRVTAQKMKAVMDKVFTGNGKRTSNAREIAVELFRSGKGNRGETGADLLNGITEYFNHHRSYKETESVSREENRFLGIETIQFETLANLILK